MMFVQQFGNLSDHTNKVNLDNTENNNELFQVFEGPSTEEPRDPSSLDVVFLSE
jgi:hypothetical protein